MEAQFDLIQKALDEARAHDKDRAHAPTQAELDEFREDIKLTAERSETERKVNLRAGTKHAVDINEDLYNVCESHEYACKCQACTDLNTIGQQLMDRKRRYQYDTEATPGTGYKEATKKVKEAQARDTLGSTEVGEDDKFLDVIEALQKRIGGNTEVSLVGYSEGHAVFGVRSDVDELPPGKELADIVRALRPGGNRRESPMDRRVPEDVSALERFEARYHELSHRFQLGHLNARDLRELISDAFAELMESLEKVSKGQTGLAV